MPNNTAPSPSSTTASRVSSRIAYKELKELVDRGLVDQIGKGGSTYYELATGVSADDERHESLVASSQELTDLQNRVFSALTRERKHSDRARPVTGLPPRLSGRPARGAGLVNMRDTLSPRRGTLYPASCSPADDRLECLPPGRRHARCQGDLAPIPVTQRHWREC